MQILQVNSSIKPEGSVSSALAFEVARRFREKGHQVVLRDVAKNPVSAYTFDAMVQVSSNNQNSAIVQEYSELTQEVLKADVLIIAAPMYNFSIPLQLKAYFDAIAQRGVTFTYESGSAVGLLKAKRAIVILSRGGEYKSQGLDFQEQFIKTYLQFLGVESVDFIFAQAQNMPQAKLHYSEALESVAKLEI